MKKFVLGLFVVLTLLAVASCAITVPLDVTNNSVGSKVGEASGKLFFWGGKVDASLQTAAQNGGITKIATVDVKVKTGFFSSTYTTIVTGE